MPQTNNPQGLNRYSYVSNRPLSLTDPTGHDGRPPKPQMDQEGYEGQQETPPPTPPGGRKYTQEDKEALARMMWGEERGVGEGARIAAAWTAINRLLGAPSVDDYGNYSKLNLVDVITAKGQYQGYDPSNPLTCLGLAGDILSGGKPDPTGGATWMGNYYPDEAEYQVATSYDISIPEEYHSRVIGPDDQHRGAKPLVVANFEYHNLEKYAPLPVSPPGGPQWK